MCVQSKSDNDMFCMLLITFEAISLHSLNQGDSAQSRKQLLCQQAVAQENFVERRNNSPAESQGTGQRALDFTRRLEDQAGNTGIVPICRQVPGPAGKHRE